MTARPSCLDISIFLSCPDDREIQLLREGAPILDPEDLPEKDENTIELQPESSNPEHKPIRIDEQTDFEISGVVVGAIIGTRRERTSHEKDEA